MSLCAYPTQGLHFPTPLSLPSAFSGNHLIAIEPPIATKNSTTHTRCPSRNWLLAPAANRLVNAAGPTVRMALVSVRATAFRVPSVDGEGDMSFSAS